MLEKLASLTYLQTFISYRLHWKLYDIYYTSINISKSLHSEHFSSLLSIPLKVTQLLKAILTSIKNGQTEMLLIYRSAPLPKDVSVVSLCFFFSLLLWSSCNFRMMFRISSLFVLILGGGNQFSKFMGSSKLRIGFWK